MSETMDRAAQVAQRAAVAEAVAYLCAAYPRQVLPDESVAIFVAELSDINARELIGAVKRLVRRSTFLPSISEIRREVATARLGLPSPSDAWSIANGKRNMPVSTWPNEIRAAFQAAGGSWAFRTSERPELLRRQFEEDYARRVDEAIVREMDAAPPPPLALDRGSYVEVLPGPVLRVLGSLVTARHFARLAGPDALASPTDEERADAIEVLRRAGTIQPGTISITPHPVWVEAQRIMDEATEEDEAAAGA